MTEHYTHPGQPDGIHDDSRDMPDPKRAARRVLAYVAQAGDGLYDTQGGRPLYGRDLEALCRAVARTSALEAIMAVRLAELLEAKGPCSSAAVSEGSHRSIVAVACGTPASTSRTVRM